MAYREAEAAGLSLWCQDEAGPYQAVPQPGASWQLVGCPARQPHEYLRGGTAKLLTLFRPATGELRAQGVATAPNSVLHPWLQGELTQVLATLPPLDLAAPARPALAQWAPWLDRLPPLSAPLPDPLPPLRLILVWDNLAGHKTPALVSWLLAHGILPLYTPLSGSWLNMAESVQRIVVPRALAGQHPQSAADVIGWLDDTVTGWNRAPTPFTWGGKRQPRRHRARQRRLGGSGATLRDHHSFAT